MECLSDPHVSNDIMKFSISEISNDDTSGTVRPTDFVLDSRCLLSAASEPHHSYSLTSTYYSITTDYIAVTLTTTVMALRWPTKSFLVCQPCWFPRSMICAVGPELFIACADTIYCPSGDQSRRRTWVVPPHYVTHRHKLHYWVKDVGCTTHYVTHCHTLR